MRLRTQFTRSIAATFAVGALAIGGAACAGQGVVEENGGVVEEDGGVVDENEDGIVDEGGDQSGEQTGEGEDAS